MPKEEIMVHKMKVAAVQMRAELGNVKSNLSTAEALVREAFRKGAKWVILPEFFPSAVAFAPNMLTAWRRSKVNHSSSCKSLRVNTKA